MCMYVSKYISFVQQKPSGLKFCTTRSGIDVTYSRHHNSSRLTFPIFVHSWPFSVFSSLQPMTPRVYINRRHLLNLKLKHEFMFINLSRLAAS
jgi:hypothetical protein